MKSLLSVTLREKEHHRQECAYEAKRLESSGIRKESVARVKRAISTPGFKVDSLKLAEALVVAIGATLFSQCRLEIAPRRSPSGEKSLPCAEKNPPIEDS